MSAQPLCLVTGASGYIGGRLVPELLAAGYPVRCMARDPAKLSDRSWSGDIDVAKADVMDAAAVRRALAGAGVAYYLIHSHGTGSAVDERAFPGSSTWAGSSPASTASCRRTCARAARSGTSCWAAACRPPRCRRP